MDLANLQHHWESWGGKDPLWAVLSKQGTEGGGWDPEEFFRTGEKRVANLVARLPPLDLPTRFQCALDFGCGVGRIAQALCGHAERVVGVDIADTMIEQARVFNKHGDRCSYEVNTRDDLSMFGDGEFDLVHSMLVFQHMHPLLQRRYLRELLRVLAEGGVGLLQMASDFRQRPPAPDDVKTTANGPLPESAWSAGLATVAELGLAPWELATQPVSVTNLGETAWPALGDEQGRFQIKLGSRWRDASNNVVCEGQRTVLIQDLGAGMSVDMPLRIAAPETPGRFSLEIDMIQENAGRFSERGSTPAVIEIDVREKARKSTGDPVIEMYGISRPEVVALLQSGGATIALVDNPDAGKTFAGHQYWFSKAAARS